MMKSTFKKQKGQGVVEYAGALVIGAAVVATVLFAGPNLIQGVFTQIQTSIQTMFTSGTAQVQ
jgi:hypothetical protein